MLVIMMVAPAGISGAEEAKVELVAVSVTSNEVSPPARVAQRMERSIATVGEHVLVGHKVAEIVSYRQSYEKIIKEVFDRVLVGYTVKQVLITPGKTAHIDVVITPWGDVMRDVRLEVDFGALPPEAIALVKRDLGDLEEQISSILVGMPVEAVDWSGGVAKATIRETLAAQLPEFRANLEIMPGQITVVKLALLPAGPIVQDVQVAVRSQSIPNILLLEARQPVEDAATMLRGLPVAFVERHGDFFRDRLTAAVASNSVVKRYGLGLSISLNSGVDTEIKINAESKRYRVTLEGFLDVGRKEDSTSARLHFGNYLGKQHEAFVETTFIPESVSWKVTPGWGYRIAQSTETGIKYDLNKMCSIIWVKNDLGKNWTLRLERLPASGYTELGVRYKLHEYLSAEYVFTNDNKWLRLVGNM
ncbi:MAG: hypothetical protein H6Q73_1787 [Firmicutes bacterium]|nr:hypothetical protein [Bacillota bacterium]